MAKLTITQGGQANYTGTQLQEFVYNRLQERGYKVIDRKRFDTAIYFGQPLFAVEYAIGKSIYGTQQFCDFILFHPEKWPDGLVIEAKWQESAGSVDEKYPYLVLNIQMNYGKPTILLLDGGGYKPGAEKWVRAQAKSGFLKNVFNMGQFQKWVNKGNL